jgi:glutamine phosphoribosylpyrophosphate amidotransferase
MCGLAGVVVGDGRRSRSEVRWVVDVLSRLLILSEHRGPHATGVAWLRADGSCGIEKAPLPAGSFVRSRGYERWCRSVAGEFTLLMGHTRYPTQGSHRDNRNNQPLVERTRAGVLLTHNGHIPAVGQYFRCFALPRRFEVDSELLLRLACRRAGRDGVDVVALLQDTVRCAGHITAVLAALAKPEEVVFVRRGRPICLAYHHQRRLLVYASERWILTEALDGGEGWRVHCVPERAAWVVHCARLSSPIEYPFA